ncbi:hypothetical protein [Candidatus Berkiella aquae]|uniref:Uncharacterized protein n=1 Tax=Candidatus Berkiella aquae TaxID=295108 RepID=A0A0Q9YLE3_9GAMM|nr:hypothetical protein [Candidatus Berkiella aquae]MCS5711509.1 hypothetical protein [Candidatus Berkiella aquae]
MLNSFWDFVVGLSSRSVANSGTPTITNDQPTLVLESDSDDDSEYVASDESDLESSLESDEDNDLESESEEDNDQQFDLDAYVAWRTAQEEEKGTKRLASERRDIDNELENAKRLRKR